MAKQNNGLTKIPELSEETVSQMIANQAAELQLRSQQLAVQKESLAHNRDLALHSIAAEKEDRADSRNHDRCIQRNRYIFGGVIIFLAIASVCVLAGLGKDALAAECVKMAAFLGTGFLGGYAVGKRRPDSAPAEHESDDS